MCASMLNFFPSYFWHWGGWCRIDVVLVLQEEVVDELLELFDIAIVYWCPGLLYNGIDLVWVRGVCPQ